MQNNWLNIFFDSKGDFMWAGIAAIIAALGALSSLVFSLLSYRNSIKSLNNQKMMEQKKIDADIISKSRMHWIDNTKEISTDFLVDALRVTAINRLITEKLRETARLKDIVDKSSVNINNISFSKTNKEGQREKNNDIVMLIKKIEVDRVKKVKEINDLSNAINKSYTLLKLNFSSNSENIEIIDNAKLINDETRSFIRMNNILMTNIGMHIDWDKEVEEARKRSATINKKIDDLTFLLRDYYKKEWEKVKRGE